MHLPFVNQFNPAYDARKTRQKTYDEVMASGLPFELVKIGPEKLIGNAKDAAFHMATEYADNGLENHIDRILASSLEYAAWKSQMPTKTPSELRRYQTEYPKYSLQAVSDELETFGVALSEGQSLFHAGLWTSGDRFVTDRLLSTSLCPQVALRNVDHNAKAFDAGRVDLLVIHVSEPRTKCFAFTNKNTSHGHEKEVVFAPGAELMRVSEEYVGIYPTGKNYEKKDVPIYVIEVDIR